MRFSAVSRFALGIFSTSVLLAGCGGSRSAFAGAGALPRGDALVSAGAERVLYSFAGGSDGAYPGAAPISIDGELYGTTVLGGNGGCADVHACGTVYKVSASGQEHILHVFKSGTDGEAPGASLINVGGTLFGTTIYGGASGCKSEHTRGCGTVFTITTSGKELVLYRFAGGAQGAMPNAPLTAFKGSLYGEAAAGGIGKCAYGFYHGCGLIFKMSPSGNVAILYTFKGGKDAGTPSGGLLMLKEHFYGTTSSGGSYQCYFSGGCGTVFEVTPAGTETILHRFRGSPNDGAIPGGGLVALNGNLYGVTFSGGKNNCGLTYYLPCGTVFEVTASGKERIVYNFKGGADGGFPNGIIAAGGNLYGTTPNGGAGCGLGCGTVFKMTPSGQKTILYKFAGPPDGSVPESALIDAGGTLYGTSEVGGTHGDGTIYVVTP